MVYLDTMIIIYLLEDNHTYAQSIEDELKRLWSIGHEFASSTLTLTEYLSGTTETTNNRLKEVQGLSFVTLDETIAAQAGILKRRENLKIGDAVHLATCIHTVCEVLFTNDAKLARAATKYVNVLQPAAA